MKNFTQKTTIEVNTTELTEAQIRLIRKINCMLEEVLTTDDENSYFSSSSDLMKAVANAVKDANFSQYWSQNSQIPYATQALEYSVDSISEDLSPQNIVQLDN